MERKERFNWIYDGKYYVGYPVNLQAVTVQAESLEDLKIKAKSACQMYLKFISEIIEQEDPFEMKEFQELINWLNNISESDEQP